jgi:CRISPR-associated endonuclease/helicase Cas3
MNFADFTARATAGMRPYPYQVRLADEGLPDVLNVPTGAGKTLAAVLPWLYRRINGVEDTRWLVVVLPQRSLVEQTTRQVRQWLGNLDLDVDTHVLMGGQDSGSRNWMTDPDRTRIFVGTQDMVLSRLLMRGFAEPRPSWPRSFGLLHAGVQFVFDEVQLMGPGLATSLQLDAFRHDLGIALPCRSMWMSATVDLIKFRTADFRRKLVTHGLADDDREHDDLRMRLNATRTVEELELDADAKNPARQLATRVLTEHCPGTRTLVACNTVDRATKLYQELGKLKPEARLVLLHSRFRPADRHEHAEAAVATTNAIVVSTQVLEAGVDLTSRTLITELAPWSSIVQRAGRCNRDGKEAGARLLWLEPPAGRDAHLPYDAEELANTATALRELQGQAMTGEGLAARDVKEAEPEHRLLRRSDLIGLFDTAPDLAGNDVDVSPFIRDDEDRSVFVAWRDLAQLDSSDQTLGREELCPAPIGQIRALVEGDRVQVYDQNDGRWRRALRKDIRPTALLVLDAARGGYLPEIGLSTASRTPVEPVPPPSVTQDASSTDPTSTGARRWVELEEHLADTEHAAAKLLDELRPHLTEQQREAVRLAARYHDLGKAHPVFHASLARSTDQPPARTDVVYAKSPGDKPLRHNPPGFRHELVSALLLRQSGLLDGVAERDLVVYLALAHHGKVRLAVRGRDGEPAHRILGVTEGDETLDNSIVAATALSLAPARLGEGSFTDRALLLCERADLGPFRLAFCEAVVRAADSWASIHPRGQA